MDIRPFCLPAVAAVVVLEKDDADDIGASGREMRRRGEEGKRGVVSESLMDGSRRRKFPHSKDEEGNYS